MTEDPPRRTLIVTAGAYVGAELAAEFGRLPPAFLPVGNRRLILRQHAQVHGCFDRTILTIPAGFAVGEHDRELLEQREIELLPVPEHLQLTESILHAIVHAGIEGGSLAVLHGDTLIYDIAYDEDDALSISSSGDNYSWTGCTLRDGRITDVFELSAGELGSGPVLSGFFHFSDLNLLVLSLAGSGGNFVNALQRYIAKRGMRALESGRWLDFGHIHTYYTSRSRITTERIFNSLAIADRVVAKQSTHGNRIAAEAGWYEQIPPALRIYLPQYLGRSEQNGAPAYGIEFLYMASLADLFVFGLLPEPVWTQIFRSCGGFLDAAALHRPPPGTSGDPMALYLPKTLQRLGEFASAEGIDLEHGWQINGVDVPGLTEIAQRTAARISPPESRHLSLVHGDSCFSNILYDFRSHSVRLIDPRGQDAEGRPTIWGDNRYDLAKLHHSVIGYYDLIVAGYCPMEMREPYRVNLKLPASPTFEATRAAFNRVFAATRGEDMAAVEAISLHLFLSMLPLHSDSPERQKTLLANALRLYVAMIEKDASL